MNDRYQPLRDALERLLDLADGFSVSGVYFNEFRKNHEGSHSGCCRRP